MNTLNTLNTMDTLQFPDSPMDKVCSGVNEALEEFVSREVQYIYSPNDRRKLFSLEDREDFVRNSDLSVDEYIQKHNMKLVVKFSSELSDDNEELLVLPVGQTQINVGKYLFEMIVLSLPIKIIHPGVKDGSLETETLKRLREFESNVLDKKDKSDPRWDKLKDLI